MLVCTEGEEVSCRLVHRPPLGLLSSRLHLRSHHVFVSSSGGHHVSHCLPCKFRTCINMYVCLQVDVHVYLYTVVAVSRAHVE